MIRNVDIRCPACSWEKENIILAEDDLVRCQACGHEAEQVWWKRPRGPAQWDDSTAVLVHVHPATGDVRYVGSHDAKLKPGYERVYLRSLHDVDKFERQHGVANERMHFDRNGRGLDDSYRGERMTH